MGCILISEQVGMIVVDCNDNNRFKELNFLTLRTSYLTPTKITHAIQNKLWLVVNS